MLTIRTFSKTGLAAAGLLLLASCQGPLPTTDGSDPTFNITIDTTEAAPHDAPIREAVGLWEGIIRKGVHDTIIKAGETSKGCPEFKGFATDTKIDDLYIKFVVKDTGSPSTLAVTGLCFVRSNNVPVIAVVAISPTVQTDSNRMGLLVHEIGHALGFMSGKKANADGTDEQNLLFVSKKLVTDSGTSNPVFNGVQATKNNSGVHPPLQPVIESHWKKTDNEVLTPSIDSVSILSGKTIGAFADMGYEVNYDKAGLELKGSSLKAVSTQSILQQEPLELHNDVRPYAPVVVSE